MMNAIAARRATEIAMAMTTRLLIDSAGRFPSDVASNSSNGLAVIECSGLAKKGESRLLHLRAGLQHQIELQQAE